MAEVKVLVSSPTKEGVIRAINTHFYSTSYSINDEGKVTWKGGEVKDDLTYRVRRGRHQILSKTYM